MKRLLLVVMASLVVVFVAAAAFAQDITISQNLDFEQGLTGWTAVSANTTGLFAIDTAGCVSGRCLKIDGSATSASTYAWGRVGKLIPGRRYFMSGWFKSPLNAPGAAVLFYDADWNKKNADGSFTRGKYRLIPATLSARGAGIWNKAIAFFETPLVDEAGESTAQHNWELHLYGKASWLLNTAPVYADQLSIVPYDGLLLPPYGCSNDANEKCLDWGAANERLNGIDYTGTYVGAPEAEGGTNYRQLAATRTIDVTFPAFNVDAAGLPLSPMLLEVRFKDTIDLSSYAGDARAKRYSAVGYVKYGLTSDDSLLSPRPFIRSFALGERGDGQWRYTQQVYGKNAFQLLRALNGTFSIRVVMPAGGTSALPLDYLALRSINESEYQRFINLQRDSRGFFPVPEPKDLAAPLSYPSAELLVFPRDPMRPIYRSTRPRFDEIKDELAVSAVWGEVEPALLGLYSETGLTNLSFIMSDLLRAGGSEVLPASAITVQKIAYSERRLTSYHVAYSPKAYGLIPDRLENFQLLSIAAGTSQPLWLKFRVPAGLPGGIYQGQLRIIRGATVVKTVSIRLDLLPLSLDQPANINPTYHDPYSRIFGPKQEEVLRFFKELDIDMFVSAYGAMPIVDTARHAIIDWDLSLFEARLGKMLAAGLAPKKTMFLSLGGLESTIFGTNQYGPPPGKDLYARLSDDGFKAAYSLAIRKTEAIAAKNGLKFVFSVVDEPGADALKRIISDRLYTIIKEAGAQTTVTYYVTCEQEISSGDYITPTGKIPPLTSLVDYKMWHMSGQGAGFAKNYTTPGYYTTYEAQHRNPIYNRMLHGFFAYASNTAAISAYAVGDFINDPFDEFDADPHYVFPFTYPDFNLAYPAWSGEFMPVVGSEGIREGIKDAKYIATLKRLIAKQPGTVATEAAAYLAKVKGRIKADYANDYATKFGEFGYYEAVLRDVSETGNPQDFEAFSAARAKMREYIRALAVAPAPPRNVRVGVVRK